MQKIEWTPKERYGEGFRSSFESHSLGVTLNMQQLQNMQQKVCSMFLSTFLRLCEQLKLKTDRQ